MDEKILEQFPPHEKGKDYIGTREYWKSIFSSETNRDTELHKAFSELHHKLVEEIIQFCKEHKLEVDEVHINTDGIRGSRDYGQWTCCTDSSMTMYGIKRDEKYGFTYTDREKPFLYEY